MTATSSSDRYDAAREALHDWDSGEPSSFAVTVEQGNAVAIALRALIESPATEETPKQIADRILQHSGTSQAILPAMSELRGFMEEAVQAGILAAWESWEPENSPGYEPEQTTPAFKPEGEPDMHRDAWEYFATEVGKTPFLIKIIPVFSGKFGKFPVTPDQARRILEMLSSEAGA